ncbi:MAG TPA: hypothetical protein VNY82_19205 [Steroidobacteraceae bacterium]|nr:hypothetical protein [Steroidobacteraceae bacterium]
MLIVVGVEAVAAAVNPLKDAWLLLGVESKPVPVIVTAVPGAPMVGLNPMIVGGAMCWRPMDVILPAAS